MFETVNVAVTEPCGETEPGETERPLVANVVYESPKPNRQRALYPEPGPEFVPSSWSKNFGSSPGVDGPPVSKSPAM